MTKTRIALLALMFVAISYVSLGLPTGRASVAGSWTQTSQADWQSDTLNNLDASSSPGYVKLASGGSFAQMGLPAQNTSYRASNFNTWIQTAPETLAPVSGLVTRYNVFASNPSSSTIELKIFRENSTHIIFVGQSPPATLSNGFNTFALATPIPVQRGDILGFYAPAGVAYGYLTGRESRYSFGDIAQTLSLSSWSSYYGGLDWSVQADIVPAVTGSLVSSLKDTGGTSAWGTLSWNGIVPGNTWMSFYTRTSNDGYTWSPWSANYTSNGSQITSPAGRFIQYQATLTSENITATPALHSVTITYSTTPAPSSILLAVSTQSATPNSAITVTGTISPPTIATVTLTYTRPDHSNLTRTVTSTATGFFSDTYSPDQSGTWKVTASWAGTSQTASAQSIAQSFEVQSQPSFLQTYLPWLILAAVVVGFGVALFLTKPKAQKP